MLFSIITATFNSEDTIGSTLESLNIQKNSEYEHIVVDGASNDNTLAVVESNSRIKPKIISEKDNGIFDALNKGIKNAKGEYIGFLHSDDTYANENVLQLVSNYIREFNPDMIYGDLKYISKAREDKIVRYWRAGTFNTAKLKFGWMPPHPTFFLRKSLYDEFGCFNTKFKISADYDSMLRFLKEPSKKVVYIDEVLVNMKVGGNSNKISNLIPKMKEDYAILSEHGYQPLLGLFCKNIRKIRQFR